MAYSSLTVANTFLELAKEEGEALTNMKLQKLVYLAHGYCLALLDRPMLLEQVQAWKFGPVIPELYQKLRIYGAGGVTDFINGGSLDVPRASGDYAVIKAVWNAFKQYTGSQLSTMTHKAGSPWSQVWATGPFKVIPAEIIQSHYKASIERGVRAKSAPIT
jgi:uncharacterized phage-associated protein